jgi:3'(2'), 5'-bisphosphate nucleotidase
VKGNCKQEVEKGQRVRPVIVAVRRGVARSQHLLYDGWMDDMTLLDLAFDLARDAGAVILQVRARGFDTLRKADASPVTEADHAAEALIVAGLRAACPEIPVVAEEEIAAGHVPAHADAYWLVDPLDGTREFAAGHDHFAVCIGLVRDGHAVLGVVGAPVEGAVFGGIVGRGAWRRDAAGRRPIAARTAPEAGIDVMASRHYSDDPRLAPFLAGRKVASVSHIGSALKFCRVAEGLADVYPRFGRTMEWDTAAAQALVEAAGGKVMVMATGEKLRYGKPDWENTSFVCTGRD